MQYASLACGKGEGHSDAAKYVMGSEPRGEWRSGEGAVGRDGADRDRHPRGDLALCGASPASAGFCSGMDVSGRYVSRDRLPPLSQTGSYRLIGGKAGRLTVELYDQHGDWGTENRTITSQPASDGRSMMIDGQGPFECVRKTSDQALRGE